MADGSACIDDVTWASFQAEELAAHEADAIRGHLATCSRCQERLRMSLADTMTLGMPTEGGAPRFAPGASVGRYVVIDLVGSGGMGEVYMARDPELDRLVALKVLRRHKNATPSQRARLVHEAQAMARLSHPNVVAVHDVGVAGGDVFLTMELVAGVSLRTWRGQEARPIEAIVERFLEAGRGLAAAHDAGIVHRDFKPDNVLVPTRGQAKVTDFGIARAEHDVPPSERRTFATSVGTMSLGEESPESTPRSGSLASSLGRPQTLDGARLGTPQYMAPEQHLGDPADARSDQFSFAVALYQSLYEELPFGAGALVDLRLRVLAGKLRPAPAAAKVPAALRRVLVRALAREPSDRYPSMHALLDHLARDPHRLRRRFFGVAAGVTLAGLSVVAGGVAVARQRETLCAGGEALAREAWSTAAGDSIQRAFEATALPDAPATATQVRTLLDAYAKEWARSHRRACEATRLRGEQPDSILAARMACLEGRRKELRALTTVLAQPDRTIVLQAVRASRALEGVDACDDVQLLAKEVPLPSTPAARAEVEALRDELAHAKAYLDTGKLTQGRELAEPLVQRARQVAFRPVEAEALLLLGTALDRLGDGKSAIATLKDAFVAAEAASSDRTKAEAELALVAPLVDAGRFGEAAEWLRVTEATEAHLGQGNRVAARRAGAAGWLAIAEGRFDDAIGILSTALRTAENDPSAEPLLLASNKNQLASAYEGKGELRRASELYAEVDATFVRILGGAHPERMAVLGNQANVLVELGRCDEAIELLGVTRADHGPGFERESIRIAVLSNTLGVAHLCRRRFDAALAAFREGARIARGLDPSHWLLGVTTLGEANVALERGAPAEALPLYASALSLFERTFPKEHPFVVEGLAGRGRALLALGQRLEALAVLDDALARLGKAPPPSTLTASLELATARALLANGRDEARARNLAESARRRFESLGRHAEESEAKALLRMR